MHEVGSNTENGLSAMEPQGRILRRGRVFELGLSKSISGALKFRG